MRRLLLLWLVAIAALPAAAHAQAEAPVGIRHSGGASFGGVDGFTAARFSVAPGRVRAGSPVTVSVRIAGPVRRVRARVMLGGAIFKLGNVRTGRTVTRRFTLRLAPGTYSARLRVRETSGVSLIRTPARTGRFPVTVISPPRPRPTAAASGSAFPIRGAWSFGGPEARFGAGRSGHIHQGQDVFAAEGTPLVSPVAGSVFWRRVQPGGAGHYLIIRGRGGRDYVFMHLVAGSERVAVGDVVKPGRPIGQVGHTGRADGSHLHFEIWPHGWYAPGSKPIDPLPQLTAWAAGG